MDGGLDFNLSLRLQIAAHHPWPDLASTMGLELVRTVEIWGLRKVISVDGMYELTRCSTMPNKKNTRCSTTRQKKKLLLCS